MDQSSFVGDPFRVGAKVIGQEVQLAKGKGFILQEWITCSPACLFVFAATDQLDRKMVCTHARTLWWDTVGKRGILLTDDSAIWSEHKSTLGPVYRVASSISVAHPVRINKHTHASGKRALCPLQPGPVPFICHRCRAAGRMVIHQIGGLQ